MFDDPGSTQSTSHCVCTILIICLIIPVIYKAPVAVCITYHNMFDDPGFTQSASDCVYTIIIICLMNPVLHKVPVTVCILLS